MTRLSFPTRQLLLSPQAHRSRTPGKRLGTALALSLSGLVIAGFSPQVSGAAVRRVPFHQYSSCPKLLKALRDLTLPQVGPYGLGGVYYPTASTGGNRRKATTKAASAPANTVAPAAAADTVAASGPPETAAPAAAPAPAVPVSGGPTATQRANSSATNVQEVGVDEGDTIENDGRYLYSAVGGLLRIIDTTTGKQVSDLGRTNGSEQLLLDGDKLAVVSAQSNGYPETIVTVWDVADRALPKRLNETHLEGSPLAVRNVNNRVRVVLETGFVQRLKFVQPVYNDPASLVSAQNTNRRIVKTSGVDAWLPRSFVVRGNGQSTPVKTAIDCREVGRPEGNVGLGFTWVATVDLNTANPREGGRGSGGVIAAGQVVYASKTSLFVATTQYGQNFQPQIPRPQILIPQPAVPQAFPSQGFAAKEFTSKATTKRTAAKPRIVPPRVVAPQQPTTAITMFDLTPPDGATYRATGTVPGTLLNQFSMSDWSGNLRVATTSQRLDFGTQQASGVHILKRNGRELTQVGVIDGLGKDERIYAVRFVGDLGYVVTFRQTDPLYVVDLHDPTSPELVGELKIPGYSSYLQPIGPGRLLGIGQDATDGGRVRGTQLSLFDISNPRAPKRLASLSVGGSSQAEYDHHAFLWWAATRDVIIPFNSYSGNGSTPSNGVVIASVSDLAITERGRVSHEGPIPGQPPVVQPSPNPGVTVAQPAPGPVFADPIQRSTIVNGNLVTISGTAVKSTELTKFGTLWYFRSL